jgi:tetratricopeptide (TPR) repeat protein
VSGGSSRFKRRFSFWLALLTSRPIHNPQPATHAFAAAVFFIAAAVSPAIAGEAEWKMLHDQAEAHFRQGSYLQSELFSRAALKEAESSFGAGHRLTEQSLASLYAALRFQEKYEEALSVVSRLIELRTKRYGADDASTAIAMHGSAEILLIQKRFSEAEKMQRRALAVMEKKLGQAHFNTAVALHNLGTILSLQKRYKEGEEYLRRALVAKEKALKPGHLSIAHTLDQLAVVLNAQGREIEAARYKKRADGIRARAQQPKPGG